MSATDILEQLKNLPPGEQAAFDKLLRQWRSAPAVLNDAVTEGVRRIEAVAAGRVKGLTEEQFLTRLRNIYGKKTTGDSQNLISELRGDR